MRSDGTVTYVGKDMAYQLWKFGLLGKDFHYRVFARTTGRATALVDDFASVGGEPESAGVRTRVLGLQRHRHAAVVPAEAAEAGAGRAGLRGPGRAFGPLFVRDGRALARDGARARLHHRRRSGPAVRRGLRRKGLGVKADDLIDRLTDKAASEVAKRNPELSPDQMRRIAEAIAIAAVRYFMVKFSRGKVIIFDIDEALSFEGESGPYLQYAVVRANNIFNKLKDRDGIDEARRARRASRPRRPTS